MHARRSPRSVQSQKPRPSQRSRNGPSRKSNSLERQLQIGVLAIDETERPVRILLEARRTIATDRSGVPVSGVIRIQRVEHVAILIDDVIGSWRQPADCRRIESIDDVRRQVRAADASCVRAGIVPTVDDPVAVPSVNDLAARIVDAEHDVALTVVEVRAEEAADERLLPVAFLAHAVLNVEVDAFEVALEHEIDDTGNGVRTVDGRGAAGDHLDPIDGRCRNGVDVHDELAVDRLHAPPVEEHQRAVRADAAQVERSGAGSRARRRKRRVRFAELRLRASDVELRQLIQRGFETEVGPLTERLRIHRYDRGLRGIVAANDTRPCDDDLFQSFFLGDRRAVRRRPKNEHETGPCGTTADVVSDHWISPVDTIGIVQAEYMPISTTVKVLSCGACRYRGQASTSG